MHKRGTIVCPLTFTYLRNKMNILKPSTFKFHHLLHPWHSQARLGMASLVLESILELTVKFDIVRITFNS